MGNLGRLSSSVPGYATACTPFGRWTPSSTNETRHQHEPIFTAATLPLCTCSKPGRHSADRGHATGRGHDRTREGGMKTGQFAPVTTEVRLAEGQEARAMGRGALHTPIAH